MDDQTIQYNEEHKRNNRNKNCILIDIKRSYIIRVLVARLPKEEI